MALDVLEAFGRDIRTVITNESKQSVRLIYMQHLLKQLTFVGAKLYKRLLK